MEMYNNTLANPFESATKEPVTKPEVARVEPKKESKKPTKPKSRRGEPKNKVYVEPTPLDILFGRGGSVYIQGVLYCTSNFTINEDARWCKSRSDSNSKFKAKLCTRLSCLQRFSVVTFDALE